MQKDKLEKIIQDHPGKILQDHLDYIETKGKTGRKASLANLTRFCRIKAKKGNYHA